MARVLFLVLAAVVTTPIIGQTFTVRLLDGKSGKPIGDKNITFRWDVDLNSNDEKSVEGRVVRVDKDGVGVVNAPKGAMRFSLQEGPRDGKEPFRIAYLDCNIPPKKHQLFDTTVSEVLARGIVPGNGCSKRNRAPEPGVIVFWGMTRRWYQPDMQ